MKRGCRLPGCARIMLEEYEGRIEKASATMTEDTED